MNNLIEKIGKKYCINNMWIAEKGKLAETKLIQECYNTLLSQKRTIDKSDELNSIQKAEISKLKTELEEARDQAEMAKHNLALLKSRLLEKLTYLLSTNK